MEEPKIILELNQYHTTVLSAGCLCCVVPISR